MPSEIRTDSKRGWVDAKNVRFILFLVLVSVGLSVQAFSRPRTETIQGRAVAYSSFPLCTNGNAHYSMIIRVQHPKKSGSKFVLVHFSLPCEKSPEFDSTNAPARKFHLVRKKDCDEILTGTTDIEKVSKETSEIQPPGVKVFEMQTFWRRSPIETEPEELPFDQVIPCYSSKDLPDLPIL